VDGVDAISEIQEFGMDEGLPMMFGGLTPAKGTPAIYFVGGSPSTPSSLYKWNYDTQEPAKLLICSSSQSYDEGLISVPKQIEFPTTDSQTAFGYYYAPKNQNYHCSTDPNGPPLLVKAHGGPTACTGTSFNPSIQFWTSRGFAILDVDYGGSTGYGKEYRRRLRSAWGIVDIDDVCNGAQYLVREGLADGKRLCIDGGSAGGFTTLGALAFKDVFSAGCSLYGVADLAALAGDTHKFESRYLDGLVGKYPEDEAVYKERSPIESVDRLSCPILLLQGDEDKIVPPNQAELMHEALLKKGIPTCLKIYQGEQHGFRKAENIEDALDSELAFFGRVFGIQVPGAIDLTIDNLIS
jgi:dipeptidyl aminopeptidase/acylaminoacyl peptidase